MKPLPEEMAEEVGNALRHAELAIERATFILSNPQHAQDVTLEDALNEAQDATYRARSAFKPEAMRGGV